MDLEKMSLFSMLTRRMEWLGERQRVLAENVANADTPGYRPRDLKAQDFGTELARVRGAEASVTMARTQTGHMSTASFDTKPTERAVSRREPGSETTPVGNAVVLEEEMIKLAQVQMEHETVAGLYRKYSGMIRAAIGSTAR